MNKDLNKKCMAFTLGATHVGIFHNIGGTFNKLVESFTHVGIFHITRRVAFTLAEVLITLGIIGVVSALTIPTLVKNYQKKVTVTKLQKVHAILNQIARMSLTNDAIKSYTAGQEVTEEKTKQFFDEFIFPYLKSPKVIAYGPQVYKDCNPNSYCYKFRHEKSYYPASIYTAYSSGRGLFSTNDGIIYFIDVMFWDVEYDENGNNIQQTARYRNRTDVIADINGASGPNTFGKDLFYFIVDFENGNGYPNYKTSSTATINSNCSYTGRGDACAEKIRRDGWQIKDDYPW